MKKQIRIVRAFFARFVFGFNHSHRILSLRERLKLLFSKFDYDYFYKKR